MFLDELIEDFYEDVGGNYRQANTPGQICHTPILYTYEQREIWKPSGYDKTRTAATTFEITTAGEDAYNRTTPLADPRLETNEEFPVVRAKKRPVVLIKSAPARIPIKSLPGGPKLNRPLAVVVPCYSAVDKTRHATYPREFIDKVRRLEFPEVFFLPNDPGALDNDSLLPIYRLANAYQAHLDPTPRKLSSSILSILQGQVRYYLTGEYVGDYQTAREMLLNP